MTWLTRPEESQPSLAAAFRGAMAGPEVLKLPGTHDALFGLIAKQIGFRALYLSGAAYTASRGLPDLGLISAQEMARRAEEIIRATQLPLLVDIDTGYGGVLDVARTTREMAAVGVAAVQIEDQEMPKRCGHLSGKRLVTAETMMQKIHMIKNQCPEMVVVARSDARGVTGLDDATRRLRQYAEAGADALFPEALEGADEFRRVADALDAPLLANMTEFGRTPYTTAEQFGDLGYRMVIYPVTTLRMAAKAAERALREIMARGTQATCLPDMQTRAELYETIRYDDYAALDQKVARASRGEDEGAPETR